MSTTEWTNKNNFFAQTFQFYTILNSIQFTVYNFIEFNKRNNIAKNRKFQPKQISSFVLRLHEAVFLFSCVKEDYSLKEKIPSIPRNRKIMEKNSVASVCNPFTKRFSTIIFDLDNTLIATRKADLKACNKVN